MKLKFALLIYYYIFKKKGYVYKKSYIYKISLRNVYTIIIVMYYSIILLNITKVEVAEIVDY